MLDNFLYLLGHSVKNKQITEISRTITSNPALAQTKNNRMRHPLSSRSFSGKKRLPYKVFIVKYSFFIDRADTVYFHQDTMRHTRMGESGPW
jgi:hypothetical protein